MHIFVTNKLLINQSVLAIIGSQNLSTPCWLQKCYVCRAQLIKYFNKETVLPPCSLRYGAQPPTSVRVSAGWRGGAGDEGPHGRGGGELGPRDESPCRVGRQILHQLWGKSPTLPHFKNKSSPAPLTMDSVSASVRSCVQGPMAVNTPHYKVLFSGPGPSSVFVGYLPQTQLKRITGIRVCIPGLT